MRKKWNKPKLIVLTRSKPEESILTGCKRSGVSGEGDVFTGSCMTVSGSWGRCNNKCFANLPS